MLRIESNISPRWNDPKRNPTPQKALWSLYDHCRYSSLPPMSPQKINHFLSLFFFPSFVDCLLALLPFYRWRKPRDGFMWFFMCLIMGTFSFAIRICTFYKERRENPTTVKLIHNYATERIWDWGAHFTPSRQRRRQKSSGWFTYSSRKNFLIRARECYCYSSLVFPLCKENTATPQ